MFSSTSRPRYLILGGLFLLILAARWLVVEAYSTQVPFWDQWLFEAPLLKAAAEGQTPWLSLAGAANEHRILWTRLLQLSTFWMNNGQWDAQVLLTINAFLAAGVPLVALAALQTKDGSPPWILLTLAAAIWLCPLQWYNTLWAIQSIVYLLAICSLGGMTLVLRSPARSPTWWGGVALLLAALFCMGSGLLASAAVIGVVVLRSWHGGDRREVVWTGSAALAVIVCGVALQTSAARIEGLYAGNLGDFANSLYKSMCWPWTLSWAAGDGVPLGILLWLPAPIFLTQVVFRRKGSRLEPGSWELLAAVILWTYAQLVIMAYTRGADGRPPSWRHYDVHAIGLLANGAALIALLRPWLARATDRKWLGAAACAGLYVALLAAGLWQLSTLALNELDIRKKQHQAQITNLRAYLATGDAAAHLENKPPNHIPWDDPKYLAACLSNSTIRAMLPVVLREPIRITGNIGPNKGSPQLRENVLPPFLPASPYRRTFSSWATSDITLKESLALGDTRFPYMIIPYTFELDSGIFGRRSDEVELTMALSSGLGQARTKAYMGSRPAKSWSEAIVKLPDHKEAGLQLTPRFVWKGGDFANGSDSPSGKGWLAIMEPIGTGRLTVWTRAWRRNTGFLLGAGAFLIVMGSLLAARGGGRVPMRRMPPEQECPPSLAGD